MYAPTIKIEFTLSATHFEIILFSFFGKNETLFVSDRFKFFLLIRFKLMAIIVLERICEKYKIKPILNDPNIIVPTVPITKIGPEVVQKTVILLASSSLIKFFW